MSEEQLRMEDMGKMMLKNASIKSKDEIIHQIRKYLEKNFEVQYFLLLSRSVDYYTVFKVTSKSLEQMSNSIYNYLENSYYFKDFEQPYVQMNSIKYYEHNDELNHLELWIDEEYFQLCVFDWGVEEI